MLILVACPCTGDIMPAEPEYIMECCMEGWGWRPPQSWLVGSTADIPLLTTALPSMSSDISWLSICRRNVSTQQCSSRLVIENPYWKSLSL